ncbi:MAG: glyceraldehyde-3-phosphate dehydrogenase [Candidatus Cloacimonetes bacterium]|nr:glyceraldehyde-3-phosphate dehydrogenase [Candidatus Cloacimonadota bacterium]MCF7814664.1 glyceraldehyde-3-phosphate dehydrogenase [Candidatus Cloacimonadota bacterium]MCF7869337.1 glyceraldehyde-3-phosphate dehydrogenase [Candidatus Cloacimonadota bacterium]MCF7884550.1 glyceraldehyde-3-phosphate dehydrogenase [Candidatus Cloacimonadota bacterium]
MSAGLSKKKLLGINGLGRIGKLTLWYHILNRKFDGIVINMGRDVGKSLEDLIQTILADSTYGTLDHFLYGYTGKTCNVKIIDKEINQIEIEGFPVKILNKQRNPKDINWKNEGVRLVVECTGQFLDPTKSDSETRGSVLGHLTSGAQKVITSAPFKMKNGTKAEVNQYPTFIYGINHLDYDPTKHDVISAASCTTTGLAHMINPLLEDKETNDILTASMSTVHAATNTQSVLDSVPKSGAKDLRKNRSVINNIILSTTGAAKTLEKVLPQIINFGFMADSIRIPTNTVSLISLNITFNSRVDDDGLPILTADYLKNIYKMVANGSQKGILHFAARQNVSSDLLGFPAAIIIEGDAIHTRTGFLKVSSDVLSSIGFKDAQDINIPVTHAKIMGWYDNEFGSYVNSLGKLTEHVASHMG